jgi:tRNA-specific 2-thiouridylase
MNKKQDHKVAVAMSGGVDSSVAAALLVAEYGVENVFGLTMRLFCYSETEKEKSCCSIESVNDARLVCDKLGIPHYVINLEKEFEKDVIQNFVESYENGLTPNPCVRCNALIKFKYLFQKAIELGADYLATGHYATIKEEGGQFALYQGKDRGKDQSYFLYEMTQDQLSHTLFPLGEYTKPQVRAKAREIGLKTADKAESQDICFITGTMADFLREKASHTEGDIIDTKGKRLGQHEGLAFYTIGQRKGLGGGYKKPMYVVGLNIAKNQLIVGSEEELYENELELKGANWIINKDWPLDCVAKIRYQAREARCTVEKTGEKYKVLFLDPQKAITPGQSIVFYQKDKVLGGGIIAN